MTFVCRTDLCQWLERPPRHDPLLERLLLAAELLVEVAAASPSLGVRLGLGLGRLGSTRIVLADVLHEIATVQLTRENTKKAVVKWKQIGYCEGID